jgi:hypothetical protein
MAKGDAYASIASWLESQPPDETSVRIAFWRIEEILGRPLPPSARKYPAWWANDPNHSQAVAWSEAGWRVSGHDLVGEWVELSRVRETRTRVASPRVRVRETAAKSEDPFQSTAPGAKPRPTPIRYQVPTPENTGRDGRPIVLVSCAGSKLSRPAEAKDLYVSSLFQKSRAYAERVGRAWFVLSAKHGLLRPGDVIEPYDVTLKELTYLDRRAWAEQVFARLVPQLGEGDRVVFLAGATYREHLEKLLASKGIETEAPMEGLGIGKQLQWLSRAPGRKPTEDLDRFYQLLHDLQEALGGKRVLGKCRTLMRWPRRGVYFFFEQGETRGSGRSMRVVRVGTHALRIGSRSRLWGRLKQHRGSMRGGGNHRSSIFRLHVGAALINRYPEKWRVPTWGNDSPVDRKCERPLEMAVSETIGGMSVLWLDIPDEPGPDSDRGYVERNAIALLSTVGAQTDPPSPNWLGLHSVKSDIRRSGLWNRNHLFDSYDPEFLDRFESLILRSG